MRQSLSLSTSRLYLLIPTHAPGTTHSNRLCLASTLLLLRVNVSEIQRMHPSITYTMPIDTSDETRRGKTEKRRSTIRRVDDDEREVMILYWCEDLVGSGT